jgi:hypothetical protein
MERSHHELHLTTTSLNREIRPAVERMSCEAPTSHTRICSLYQARVCPICLLSLRAAGRPDHGDRVPRRTDEGGQPQQDSGNPK